MKRTYPNRPPPPPMARAPNYSKSNSKSTTIQSQDFTFSNNADWYTSIIVSERNAQTSYFDDSLHSNQVNNNNLTKNCTGLNYNNNCNSNIINNNYNVHNNEYDHNKHYFEKNCNTNSSGSKNNNPNNNNNNNNNKNSKKNSRNDLFLDDGYFSYCFSDSFDDDSIDEDFYSGDYFNDDG
jgi:hypothetical protein